MSSDQLSRDQFLPDQSRRLTASVEVLAVVLAAGAFYIGLHGDLPFHDVARFVGQIESDRPVWDIAHIYMQPATLLWHRYLAFGGSAEDSQKAINALAAALSAGVFAATLLRLNLPFWQRMSAVALLVGSCSMVMLAPTGHMKLLTAPFTAAALYFALAWEQQRAASVSRISPRWLNTRDLLLSAIFLALAASLLASALASAPFITLLVIVVARRAGDSWSKAFGAALLFACVCGALFAVLVCVGFLLFADQPLNLTALGGSVAYKAGLISQSVSPVTRVIRSVFSSANNFVEIPDLGPLARAWLAGEVPSLAPYGVMLLLEVPLFLATLALLSVIYLAAAVQVLRGRAPLMAIAFLLGAHAWLLYCSINDPEHRFFATAPTIVLFLTCLPAFERARILPIWLVVTVALNLWIVGIPEKIYPMSRYQAELGQSLTSQDLLVYFAAYPGGQNIGLFSLPRPKHLKLDLVLLRDPDVSANYAEARRTIDAALKGGGQVVAFDVFSPQRWDAPWPDLKAHGIGKARLVGMLEQDYCIRPLPPMAEIPTWRMLPSSACGSAARPSP